MLRGEQVETLMVQWNDVCANRLPKRFTNQCENQMDMKITQAKQDRSQLSDAQLLNMSSHTQPALDWESLQDYLIQGIGLNQRVCPSRQSASKQIQSMRQTKSNSTSNKETA